MVLSTDSTANLPKEYYEKYDIKMIPMKITVDDVTYDDLSKDLPIDKFYEKLRQGSTATTAQINEFSANEYFTELLKSGEDILHIGFSSQLSGSTATLKRVAEELNATHKNKIIVIDSLNASVGQGILVMHALDMKNEGKSIDEIASAIEKLIPYSCSYFTVEQLKYLVRGGRVGKFSGIVGALLNIKPVLRVDPLGRLVSYKKVISRKKSINEMLNIVKDEADDFAKQLNDMLGVDPIVTDLTQVIGCHTGPGLLAVFFIGKEK